MINREEIENDIIKLISILRKTGDVSEYKYAMCNIDLLLSIYKIVFKEDCKIRVPHSTLLEFIMRAEDISVNQIYKEEFLKDSSFHLNVADIVSKEISKHNLPDTIKQDTMSLKDFRDISNSFFHDFGTGVSKEYDRLFKDKHIAFLSSDEIQSSETNNIFMLDKRYALVKARNDIEGLIDLAHEVGHVYAQSKMKNHEASYNDVASYYEFYSSFLERMMIKYLNDNNIMKEDTLKSNKKYFKQLEEYANDLKIFNSLKIDQIDRFNSLLSNSMIYMYGEYLALIKELDYESDREGTIERIDDYLTKQALISRDKSLDILGIEKDDLTSGKSLKLVLNKNNM